MIVAPSIDDELIELSQYINAFEFAFLQVRRFQLDSEFLVAVDSRALAPQRITSVSTQGEWDWESYWQHLNVSEDRVELAKWLVNEMQIICTEKGWPLDLRFRSYWTPFQMAGGWNVFGTQKKWATGWCIWFKLQSPPESLGLALPSWCDQHEWNEKQHQIYMAVPNKTVDLDELRPFFDKAFDHVAGLSGLVT